MKVIRGKQNAKQAEQILAMEYYLSGDTQRDIAERLNVHPDTVSDWVRKGYWNELRDAANRSPTQQAAVYQGELAAMDRAVRKKVDKDGHPIGFADTAMWDARIKAITAIKMLKEGASLPNTIEVMREFGKYISQANPVLAAQMAEHVGQFLAMKAKKSQE
jgi:hypothetical protein